MGRPKAELVLSAAEEAELASIARSRSIAAALSQRARIVLACASGDSNIAVGQRFQVKNATVGKWRARFVKHRILVAITP
jgi:putative transposase